jgi:hypothetical protein
LSSKNLVEKSPSIKGFRASSTVSRGDSLPLPRHVQVRLLDFAALVEQLEYTIKNVTVKVKNAGIPSTRLKRPD